YTGLDFDTTITDFHVDISSIALIQTESGQLSTDSLSIIAYNEVPVATLTADAALYEETLGSRTLRIQFTEETFVNYAALQVTDFTLVNPPVGLSIAGVDGQSPVYVELALAFDRTDFDADIGNFAVDINSDVLIQTRSGELQTSILPITAFVENPSATILEDAVLEEYTLNDRYLTLTLHEEEFNDFTTLDTSGFSLVNGPAQLAIESVTGQSATSARIDLVYTGLDFDDPIEDFRLDISSSILKQTGSGVLDSDSLTIIPYIETPVATITADSTVLHETRLDARSLTLDLTEERFLDYLNLRSSDFTLLNGPSGLSIDTVIGISPTQALLELAFDGTDFDITYTNFRVQTDMDILLQSQVSDLVSNNLNILAYFENPQLTISADTSVMTEHTL
ncbi:MAG: hypothetical protein KAT15_28170, partial [Bacteroidales bacterium]|nr:hypothetical protein [Bacteroidales bacterium]